MEPKEILELPDLKAVPGHVDLMEREGNQEIRARLVLMVLRVRSVRLVPMVSQEKTAITELPVKRVNQVKRELKEQWGHAGLLD